MREKPKYAVRHAGRSNHRVYEEYQVYDVDSGRAVKGFAYQHGSENARAEAKRQADALRDDLNAKEAKTCGARVPTVGDPVLVYRRIEPTVARVREVVGGVVVVSVPGVGDVRAGVEELGYEPKKPWLDRDRWLLDKFIHDDGSRRDLP